MREIALDRCGLTRDDVLNLTKRMRPATIAEMSIAVKPPEVAITKAVIGRFHQLVTLGMSVKSAAKEAGIPVGSAHYYRTVEKKKGQQCQD